MNSYEFSDTVATTYSTEFGVSLKRICLEKRVTGEDRHMITGDLSMQFSGYFEQVLLGEIYRPIMEAGNT